MKKYLAVSRCDCAKYKNKKTTCAALSHGMTAKILEDNR